MLKALAVMVLLAGILVAADASSDLRSLAQAVDDHYNHLHTLQAEFTEIYTGSGMERTESGTLWLAKSGLKKPGKMRWEYRSPKAKLFVSDGTNAWFYVPSDKQVRKSSAKTLEDVRSPLAFLLGKTKLEKELQGLSLAPDITPLESGDIVLRGIPQALADRVSEIVLEITPTHQIARILIDDVDGSTTEYRFTDQKENVAIAAKEFQFTAPPGTEIVESELENGQ